MREPMTTRSPRPLPRAAMRASCFSITSLASVALLVACGAVPVPPTTWLRLPAQAPASTPPPITAAPAGTVPVHTAEVWQLMLPVRLPGHLERDNLFVPQGSSGAAMQPLAAARWVEPLHEAVPRLLREDLARLQGGQALWLAPLPPGLVVVRQLRIEITAFEIASDGRALLTHARWSIADARGMQAPRVHEARLETAPAAIAAGSGQAEAWALAHRAAIAALAARIAATLGS